MDDDIYLMEEITPEYLEVDEETLYNSLSGIMDENSDSSPRS